MTTAQLRTDAISLLDWRRRVASLDGIFVPIRDTGTDGATYPGGRYVIDTVTGADLGGSGDGLIVDLNFAYNPSCAYEPTWACPLAQPGNTVPVAVNAGELMSAGPAPARGPALAVTASSRKDTGHDSSK